MSTTASTSFSAIILLAIIVYNAKKLVEKKSAKSLPSVHSFIPWLGNLVELLWDPQGFLRKCRAEYGPAFRMKVAGRRYVVMNHSDGIAHIMRNPHKALCSKENALLIEAVGGVTPKNLEYDLFESLGSAFSRISSNRNIPRFSASFHQHLLLAFDLFASPKPRINRISLNHFVGHCLYSSVSTALWGPDFPADTYPDFHVVDANLSRLLVPLPFLTPKHVLRAREALKARLGEYLRKRSRVKDDKEHATYEGSLLVDLILNADIPPPDQQGTLLGAMFALHSNSIRMSTWLLAYLLCDRALWCRLQQEVDSAISNHLDSKLENLLALPPTRFDQELFPLLDSALKEAIRLSTAPTLIRKVTSDCEVIIDGNNSVEVRTGEYVLTNGCAINFDEEFFHDAAHFQADRFVKGNSTTKPISAFGGGARMCKGRDFALYEMKVFTVLCLRLLEFQVEKPDGSSAEGYHPEAHYAFPTPVFFPKDLFVRVTKRQT